MQRGIFAIQSFTRTVSRFPLPRDRITKEFVWSLFPCSCSNLDFQTVPSFSTLTFDTAAFLVTFFFCNFDSSKHRRALRFTREHPLVIRYDAIYCTARFADTKIIARTLPNIRCKILRIRRIRILPTYNVCMLLMFQARLQVMTNDVFDYSVFEIEFWDIGAPPAQPTTLPFSVQVRRDCKCFRSITTYTTKP